MKHGSKKASPPYHTLHNTPPYEVGYSESCSETVSQATWGCRRYRGFYPLKKSWNIYRQCTIGFTLILRKAYNQLL